MKFSKEEEERTFESLEHQDTRAARRPPVRVMWTAEQHILDSITANVGLLVIHVQNFAGPPYRATDVNMWSSKYQK